MRLQLPAELELNGRSCSTKWDRLHASLYLPVSAIASLVQAKVCWSAVSAGRASCDARHVYEYSLWHTFPPRACPFLTK